MWTSWDGGHYSAHHIAQLNSIRFKAFFIDASFSQIVYIAILLVKKYTAA